MYKLTKKILVLILATVVIINVFAHEYILLASKYSVAKGDTLELHLFVADGFNIELEKPVQKLITKKFTLITQNNIIDLLKESKETSYPILKRAVDFEGAGLIHMERDYARITLDNKKFLEYLKTDHIENVKIKNDKEKTQQRERYSRYIKCLIQSGAVQNDTIFKTLTNQNFEIILLQNPYKLKVGQTLQAQIYFMGKPLSNKIITARNRTGSDAASVQTSRTNANGICTFKINRKGDWFIHATHMVPCHDVNDADWESFWTSYSFGIE